MAIRTLHVENPPAPPAPSGTPAKRKKKTFAEAIRSDPLSTIVTVSIDVLSVSVAAALGTWWAKSTHEYPPNQYWVFLYVPVVIAMLGARGGVYRRRLNREFLDEIGPIEATVAISTMFLLGAMLIGNDTGRPGATVVKIWICAAVLMPFGRLVRVIIQRSLRRHHHLVAPTLIVGNGRVAGHIINRLEEFPEYGLGPVGIIDAEPWFGQPGDPRPDIPWLGTPDDIDKAIRETGAQNVVIAFSRTQDQVLTHVVRTAHQNGLRVWVVPRMFDTIGERARIEHVGGTPLLALPPHQSARLAVHRQAHLRPGGVFPSAADDLAGVPHPGAPREAELPPRADLLPPAARGPRRPRLRLLEVPDDARTGCRRCCVHAQDRCRPPAAWRASTVGPRSAKKSCAPHRSTNCRSSSMCSRAK